MFPKEENTARGRGLDGKDFERFKDKGNICTRLQEEDALNAKTGLLEMKML